MGIQRNCKVKTPKISNCFSLLILHKKRFFCRNCNKTFIAKTSLIDKNISNNTELQIKLELMIKQREKDISKRLDVSVSKIDRKLSEISSHTVLRHPTLPESMNQDEFKATKDTKGKIFVIQDSRKSIDLDKYFRRYSKDERDKVKHISTDFYSGYIFLAKKLFKNAEISIDRFHIVIQAYNALNTTRIRLCYKSNPNYNKLKDFWKLLLKNENELSYKKHYSRHFKKELSQKEIVQYIINTDSELKATYECYQGLINSLKEKDFNKFKLIVLHSNANISDKMVKVLKLYKNNLKYIENSFKYDINNGIIEGTNNLIKCLKRVAFGYRKYDHFIARIFLIQGIIKE